MTQDEFIKHACEQVLRFTSVAQWSDLTEQVKVQLGFNMGAMALGLDLSKEDGFLALAHAREGVTSMAEFKVHLERVVADHKIAVDPEQVARSF